MLAAVLIAVRPILTKWVSGYRNCNEHMSHFVQIRNPFCAASAFQEPEMSLLDRSF